LNGARFVLVIGHDPDNTCSCYINLKVIQLS